MITFAYQARDASGRIVTGIQDAINEDNAVTSLMSRGLMVLSLQKKADVSKARKKAWSVKETDTVLFTRQLATMIEAGISLVQAMTALYEQCDPEASAQSSQCHQRCHHARPRWRNISRINRETSSRLQPSLHQHGQSRRARRSPR